MRSLDRWRLRAPLTAVVLWSCGAAVAAPTIIKLTPDQLTAYRGTAVLVQTVGEDVTKFDFKADAIHLTRPAENETQSLLTARYLKAVDGGETFGSVDRYSVATGGATLSLKPAGDKVFELTPHLHMLDVYLPWELLPTFAIPEAGKEAVAREKITILNLAPVEAGLRTRVTAQAGSLEITRELDAGEKPEFDFRETRANVVLYRQKYTVAQDTGRVQALESDCAFEFSQDETKIRLERKVRLEEASSIALNGPDSPAWSALLGDLPSIEKDFESRKSSEDIGKRLASFTKSAEGTPLAALGGALEFRLAAFQQFFEASAAGRVLAGVLGRKAPDFTLKDLDGKDVAFRAAVAGNKLTLLSFWGYG